MMNKIYAKKSLGQNWLVNEGVLERIVEVAQIIPGEKIVEVGPGKGALTRVLAQTGAEVFAIEKDRRLLESLRQEFGEQPNVHIIEGDILEFSPSTLPLEPGKWKLVANIPYYLTSHLLRILFSQWPQPQLSVLMVQAELAQRIIARPPDMNLLALAVQLYSDPRIVMRVSRGSFRPIPTVDSAVIALKHFPVDTKFNEQVLEYAKTAFGQRRKQLKSVFPPETLSSIGISPTARPQELSPDQWQALTRKLL
jgi:16S rRNA (adenine1518-N6/adenine1519-N6)-dimethyltransferase